MSFLDCDELSRLGLAHCGENVHIDRTVMIIGADQIHIGDNVRIDAFSILSASQHQIVFAGHSHIGAGTYIFANGGDVRFDLFSSASPGCRIYTASDDFFTGMLRGPGFKPEYRQVRTGAVTFLENAGICTNVVVLPGCTIGVNATVGSGVVVSRSIPDHCLAYERSPLQFVQKDPDVYRRVSEQAMVDLNLQQPPRQSSQDEA